MNYYFQKFKIFTFKNELCPKKMKLHKNTDNSLNRKEDIWNDKNEDVKIGDLGNLSGDILHG